MAHLILDNVRVNYPIYSSVRQRSFLSLAANRASFGRIAREAGHIPTVTALDGVTLDLGNGDRLAVFGSNGSGKTTLLKVCAGLILPNEGSVEVEGARASILNPWGGLDPERTGVQNVETIGRLMGVPRARRQALLEDVADFTELGDFLNLPVRVYSAGMLIRLVFALVTSTERDVLVVDEVIGAGDARFVEKAAARLKKMFERAKVLILATHAGDIGALLCNSAIWLSSGRIVMRGPPTDVWDAYLHNRMPREKLAEQDAEEGLTSAEFADGVTVV